ncbi:GntR family transcriptional regulator [Agrococcus sp. TSP3-2-1]|uniref:GntR family transcriptional regulator n=1 Tax=Agrococcus sp. TSP3-2-1 TaxID=2804583 RepID=UPI003CEC5201
MTATLTPLGTRRLSGQMYAELERVIVDCSLPPGTALNDSDLAAQFGVSRTPVRDTLHLLESSGLVERGRSTGWVVTPIRKRDVDELAELRSLLEPAGLPKIMEWDDERLEWLGTFFDAFPEHLPPADTEQYLARDDEFHRALIAATENSRIERMYHVVERQLARCKRYVSVQDDARRAASLEEHRAVCRAILRRDFTGAREALLQHLATAHSTLAAAIKASLT